MNDGGAGCILGGCGWWLFCLILTVAIAGFAFDYSLDVYFGKDIPWYGDCIAGTIASPVTVPAAVVGFVLKCCGVPTPIFDVGG